MYDQLTDREIDFYSFRLAGYRRLGNVSTDPYEHLDCSTMVHSPQVHDPLCPSNKRRFTRKNPQIENAKNVVKNASPSEVRDLDSAFWSPTK